MARQRDYAAEYQARNERSMERFGVSYNVQRSSVAYAESRGLTKDVAKELLQIVHQQGADARNVLRDIADAHQKATDTGRPMYDFLSQYDDDFLDDIRDDVPEAFWYHQQR